ncbi:uncharacterized protein Triagg1_4509 [Trichoderma aggressivum f. europaeum]|uniref:Uncharacterized protein n=1 Tax=Trichoderma aggressivum f. europaeum TaxID=173218 RepID=A0AAE1IDV5_9HYPO|nr:hypothetical protein Triagg1_4509 [Trichoderma aggressivum f. europaeum]
MDGLSDDSPFSSVVLVADWIDRGGFSLLVLLFAFFWYRVTHRQSDVVIIVICLAWNLRCSLIPIFYELARSRLNLGSVVLTAIVSIGLQLFRYAIWKWRRVDETQRNTPSTYLIPCRVTHSREHPKEHAFSYPYLTVGIPIGYRGNVNGMISVDDHDASTSWLSKIWRARGWFRVDAADYLERGNNKLGLRAKLDTYLRSQDANPADYPHAFLVTAPKFLGYQFNPVSFWYLYSFDRILSAVVVEMNNIFGERRPYLVMRDTMDDATRITSHNISQPTPAWINASWKKDFHMSPFNSRKGSYSLLTRDPFAGNMEGFSGIDIALDLVSSKGQPKLAVRLCSKGRALDISQMGPLEQAKFVLTWFWVGFLTFPKMVRQAALLFFYHQLHIWYRPEPLKDTLGRRANDTETKVELIFRQYLRFLVEQSTNPLNVTYVPSGLQESSEETFISPGAAVHPEQTECLKIKILTPVFYSRFVHYAHDFEAIFCELAESCTIWVDQPETLPKIFLKKQLPPLHVPSFTDYLYFKTIQRLRRRPARIKRPMTWAGSVGPTTTPEDVRGFRISPMDAFVLQYSSQETRASYRSLLARMFVADRVFFGIPAIIDALLLSGVFGVAWWLLSFGSATPY